VSGSETGFRASIPSQPRLGIALSGGTARTVAHIGVLKALERAGVRIDCIAGTSGGSLIGCMYAAGMSLQEMERRALKARWKDIAAVTVPRLGFLSSARIQHFVEQTIGDITFSELRRPFAVVATNLGNGHKRVFTTGKVAQAVRASCSIPQIFSPCDVDGELYIDGGIVEYVPVMALEAYAPQVVLAVNLGAYRDTIRRPRHVLQLAMQIVTVVSRQNVPASEARADYVIRPDMSRFGPFMLERSRDMIAVGEAETERHLPQILDLLRREAAPIRWLYDGLKDRPA
jgi:NTE family protein